MRFLVLLICIPTNTSLLAQKVIFKDNFINNKKKWQTIADSEFVVQINKGSLTFEKKSKNRKNNFCLWYSKAIDNFRTENNFIISFMANISSADDVYKGFDIQWGSVIDDSSSANPSNFIYQLNIGLNRVTVDKFHHGKGWTYDELPDNPNKKIMGMNISLNKWYTYQIIQNNNTLEVKVNNKTVYYVDIEPIQGNEIGVQQCLKSKWQMRRLRIRQ